MSGTLRRCAPAVTVPDGRTFRGLWPQNVPNTHEKPYIIALARHVNGVCEVTVPAGRADVMTSETAFEVEPSKTWRTGLRQALAYSAATGTAPGLALFGPADYLKVYLWLRDNLPCVTLWRWERTWHHITSRQAAATGQRTAYQPPDAPSWLTGDWALDDAYASGLHHPEHVPEPPTRNGLRCVPCRHVPGEFCVTCGPDRDRYYDSLGVGA